MDIVEVSTNQFCDTSVHMYRNCIRNNLMVPLFNTTCLLGSNKYEIILWNPQGLASHVPNEVIVTLLLGRYSVGSDCNIGSP